MNDLPEIINNRSVPVLFADDTNILFSHSNFRGFEENINNILETVNSLFKRNLFSLNFKEKNTLYPFCNRAILLSICKSPYTCTKFLGLIIDNNLTWKDHIELLINGLSTASYVI